MGYALITGASAGIGRALAKAFSRAGQPLILVARNQKRLEETSEYLRQNHRVKVECIVMDLSDQGAAARLYEKIAGFEVDTLVNNAGSFFTGSLMKKSPEELERLVTLNATNLTVLTRLLLNDMLQQGYGRILNVASVAAFSPIPGMACYAASKAFVLYLTEALSEELKDTGVSVTALCPGFTDTEMAQEVMTALEKNFGNLPELFLSTPEQVAQAGYDACMEGRAVEVPGLANKLFSAWSQVQPKWLLRRLTGKASRWLQG